MQDQAKAIGAAVRMGIALLEAIVDLGGIPSGHLYAQVMSKMSLGTYQGLIGSLVRGGLITEEHHVLTPTAKGRALIASGR